MIKIQLLIELSVLTVAAVFAIVVINETEKFLNNINKFRKWKK